MKGNQSLDKKLFGFRGQKNEHELSTPAQAGRESTLFLLDYPLNRVLTPSSKRAQRVTIKKYSSVYYCMPREKKFRWDKSALSEEDRQLLDLLEEKRAGDERKSKGARERFEWGSRVPEKDTRDMLERKALHGWETAVQASQQKPWHRPISELRQRRL